MAQPKQEFISVMKDKHINYLYWIAMLGLVLWFAYSKGWILANFETLSPKEASALLQKDTNVTLLDIRSAQEFEKGHIKGATLIPLSSLEKEVFRLGNVKHKKIIVYCRSGSRSIAASRILSSQGFTPLNMKGGIIAWINEGLPLQQSKAPASHSPRN
jgi:rhodanese-related sulfurtransferase